MSRILDVFGKSGASEKWNVWGLSFDTPSLPGTPFLALIYLASKSVEETPSEMEKLDVVLSIVVSR